MSQKISGRSDAVLQRMLLSRIKNLGPVNSEHLILEFGSLQALFDTDEALLVQQGGMHAEQVRQMHCRSLRDECLRERDEAQSEGIQILTPESAGYPDGLLDLADPPQVLYVQGDLRSQEKCLGIVGTRSPSYGGGQVVRRFAEVFAQQGVCVVSGMARGIDTQAHEGVLAEEGVTWAVLGSGLLDIYPKENKQLANEILERGVLISEFSLHEGPKSFHFPQRNRLISGLSSGVLVVEAPQKSGALITVNHALEQGRDVFVIPASVDLIQAKGSNQLLKEGAICVTEPEDILQHFAWDLVDEDENHVKSVYFSFPEAETILHVLSEAGPQTIDILSREIKLDISDCLTRLCEMEVKGVIQRLAGAKYGLTNKHNRLTSLFDGNGGTRL